MIDVDYDFRKDCNKRECKKDGCMEKCKDACHRDTKIDDYSGTLRDYHRELWSRALPNGKDFQLNKSERKSLCHYSEELGKFSLSSDSIAHTYFHSGLPEVKYVKKMGPEIKEFMDIACTMGGFIIGPKGKGRSFNQERGFSKTKDRFDLALDCIRIYYKNKGFSPLSEAISRYSDFFDLFVDFKGYVDFFFLNDLVKDDYSEIKPFLPNTRSPLPLDKEEYSTYKENVMLFVKNRNERIKKWIGKGAPGIESCNQ